MPLNTACAGAYSARSDWRSDNHQRTVTAKDTNPFVGPPRTARPTDPITHIGLEPNGDESLVSVLTFVIWTFCLTVGLLGFLLHYPGPRPFIKPLAPVQVQKLFVQLNTGSAPATENEHPPGGRPSTALRSDEMAPPPIPVAEPSPAIAFAVPMKGPTRIVPIDQAAYAQPVRSPTAVQRLTFGVGEGQQPPPEYPRQALELHQEGTVVVRFVVAESGRVASAEAIRPSPWPLLNDSAVRTVHERWRFTPGAVRVYDVAIHFQITP